MSQCTYTHICTPRGNHAHTQTRTHLSCWYWLIVWPREWVCRHQRMKMEWMAEGFTLSVLTQHADSRTHIHSQPPVSWEHSRPPRAGGFSCHADAAATFFIGSVSAAHTHTNNTDNALSFSLYPLSQCHCHTHMDCVFVCACESMCYISYILCVCVLYVSRRTVVPAESYPLAFTIFSKAVAPQAHAATKVCDLDAIFCASWALS